MNYEEAVELYDNISWEYQCNRARRNVSKEEKEYVDMAWEWLEKARKMALSLKPGVKSLSEVAHLEIPGLEEFKYKCYTVAKVSNQINGNYIAWSQPCGNFHTLDEANKFADELWQEMIEEAEEAGTNYMGDSIIIYDEDGNYF
jgi:hypothetical protein